MTLLALDAVSKSFGSRTVLDALSFEVNDGARTGIVGANGAGKSTLLRLLGGLEEPDAGRLVRRRGVVSAYLPQHPLGDARTPLETLLDARPDLARLERELAAAADRLGAEDVVADLALMGRVLARHERLLAEHDAAGGPGFTGRCRALLGQLGFEPDELASPTRELSGGRRKLVALAECLARDPHVLLLDEPEAHLDDVGRTRVEDLVAGFAGAVVVVSHDRYLLDETVTTIAVVDRGRVRVWPGNYSAYTLAREVELARQQELYVTQQKEIARLEAAIRRFEDWARRVADERHIKQARNKQRQIDRMEKVDRPVLERRKIALELRPHARGGERVVELDGVGVAFGNAQISTEST